MLSLILFMLRCLNPKKAHENRGSPARPVPSGKTVALSTVAASEPGESEEGQVACQYCKYLLEGAVLGDCRILRWIGSGAFGDVYEAEQLPPLSRRVAIKVMAIERVVDGESAEMFAREVNTIAALDHPNILPVLRVGMVEDGRPYLVMKYAALGSLQQFCQPAAPAPATSTPSLTPTLIQEKPAEAPAHDLAIVSAETLRIAEAIEQAASAEQASNQPAEEPAPPLSLKETSANGAPAAETSKDTTSPEAAELALHIDATPRKGESAHQEPRPREYAETPPGSTGEKGADAADQQPSAGAISIALLENTSGEKMPEPATTPAGNISAEATDQTEAKSSTPPETEDVTTTERAEQAAEQQSGGEKSANAAPPLEKDDEPAQAALNLEKAAPGEEAQPEPLPADEQDEEAGTRATEALIAEETEASVVAEQRQDAGRGAAAQEVEQISTLILAGREQGTSSAPGGPAGPARSVAPLSLQRVLGYVEQAADALYYAHQRGLIHLDVKPANLLLDAQERLMLADFGVSVLLEGYTHASLHYYVGTPLYTAPEQWLEQPRTASDQYALAVTCYQLLTGRPPFTGNLYAVMHGHLQAPPPPMSTFNPLIPAQVEQVIARALAKDPNERYPDIRAFAIAFREAVENAASAETDAQLQQRATLLLEQHAPTNAELVAVPPPLEPREKDAEEQPAPKEPAEEAGTFRELPARREQSALSSRPTKRGTWLYALLLCILAAGLVVGSSLGFVRTQRPCWLGICPQITLSTHTLTLTNDATQVIEITNTGTDTLNWQATPRPHASWLSLSATAGTLAPGHSSKLTLKTQVDHLGLDPNKAYTYTDMIDIAGGPGVVSQSIEVTENVVKELQAVSVTTSGKSFLYAQGKLQPGKQIITITNHSGHTLNWFSQYTDNNWLSVLPGQGTLKDQKSINLTVTVENPQTLPNDTYQVLFSLVGQLDNQADFTLLQTIDFSLQVSQSQAAQVAPTTTPADVTPSTPAALAFSAQKVEASGAPDGPRFNHSMVWDTQDEQLLVFGGSNGQGGLLNDLWSFNPANNTWANLTPASAGPADCSGSSPAPRMNAAMVWDSADQEVLLYGGIGSNNSALGDLWSFSPAKNSWKALACTGNGPGERGEAGVAWNGSQMLLLGGLGSSGPLSDFWAYTPGSGGGWSQLAASTPLGARTYPTMAWDGHDRQLFVFGGLGSNGQQSGDFYSYQADSGWHTIEASNGSAPMARQQAFSTWDSKQHVFLLMGGWQASTGTTYSALWAYSPAENAWWQITSLHNNGNAGVIPSRMASAMVWDGANNRAYIYAGSSGVNSGALSDLWMIVPR